MTALQHIDKRPIDLREDEILLVVCIRNEFLRLPYFFSYYRNVGVSRFMVIDNASTDASPSWLLQQPDAHLFMTQGSYAESRCGIDWINEILHRYAPGHWVLTVDADELLVYEACETNDLRYLTGSLEESGSDALACFMLDMYSKLPIAKTEYVSGTPFLRASPYFDVHNYDIAASGPYAGLPMRGGVRRRLFWQDRQPRGRAPVLTKTPLVHWSESLSYEASTHIISGVQHATQTGVLLHFKLFSDFVERALEEVLRAEHWQDAAQYEAYASRLMECPELCAWTDASVEYTGSTQLQRLGLLRSS